ncbi:MAG TPA: hypothetical protein VF735_19215 [Pyrinomonadaceae bacterium]
MSANPIAFNRGVVRPVECLQMGWNMIKGQYWLFLGITAVGLLIGSVGPMAILLGPMMCGIYLCLLARYRGEAVSFELLFKGFDYFMQSLIASLIQVVPVMLLMIPVYVVYFVMFMSKMQKVGRYPRGRPPDASEFYSIFLLMFGMMLLVVIIATVIGAFFIFTYPLIVDRRLTAIDALRASARAVIGNLGGVMGLMALSVLLGLAGMLLCYVGAFLVMPVSFAAWAVAYRQVFPAQT